MPRRIKVNPLHIHRTHTEELDGYMNFQTEQNALDWMVRIVEENDMNGPDNIRFTYKFDSLGLHDYQQSQEDGCCGSVDMEIRIQGRKAYIGCNYGH